MDLTKNRAAEQKSDYFSFTHISKILMTISSFKNMEDFRSMNLA